MKQLNYQETQDKLNLLEKARNSIFLEILANTINVCSGIKLTVTVANEYDDNSYYMDVRYHMDNFDFYELSDTQDSASNESEDECEIVHQKLKANGTSFSEVEDFLNLIPSSFWESNFGEVEDLSIDGKLLKELNKK